jgi:hypothetical protein
MQARLHAAVKMPSALLCWQASGMQHPYVSVVGAAAAGITLALHWLSPPWASLSASVAVVYGCAADDCTEQGRDPQTPVPLTFRP